MYNPHDMYPPEYVEWLGKQGEKTTKAVCAFFRKLFSGQLIKLPFGNKNKNKKAKGVSPDAP